MFIQLHFMLSHIYLSRIYINKSSIFLNIKKYKYDININILLFLFLINIIEYSIQYIYKFHLIYK